ncbi:MAG: glycosyltransferase family 2 protein [Verrucomicrobiota bacterium]
MKQDHGRSDVLSPPLVSVIIPAYNARYLREAVESVYSQTFRSFELIVVDDGSPGTGIREICAGYPEARYIRQPNAGPSVARNLGIREAKGDLIAFLDDDDIWLPEKLEKQVILLESLPDREAVGLIYTGQYMFDGDNTFGAKVDSANGMIYPYLLFGQFIGSCSSVLMPKNVFDEVGDFDSSLICTQDFELFLRISRKRPIYSIDDPLIKYRTRPDQISKDPTLNNKEDLEVLALQREHVPPGLYRRVLQFNQELRGIRYKEKAYDSLFRKSEPLEYGRWLFKSVMTRRKFPSLPSLVYLVLGFMPGRLVERISGRNPSEKRACSDLVQKQEVLSDDFTWMGVPRGPLQPEWLAPDRTEYGGKIR